MTLTNWWRRLVDDTGLLGRLRRQWPWVVMMLAITTGLVLIALHLWRRGSVVIGGALLFGGVCRCWLPQPGILTIRQRRWLDALFYFGLGLGTVVIALVIPPAA